MESEQRQEKKMMIGCLGVSTLLLFIISVIVIVQYTNRITHPITKLTDLTESLKRASDVEAKMLIINEVKDDQIFKFIKEKDSKKAELKSLKQKRERSLQQRDDTIFEHQRDAMEKEAQHFERLISETQSELNVTMTDEIEELKQIFFEFFVNDKRESVPNSACKVKYYKKNHIQTNIGSTADGFKILEDLLEHDVAHGSSYGIESHLNSNSEVDFAQDVLDVRSSRKVEVSTSYSINRGNDE